MTPVKLVLFDIDQTLVDVLPCHERAYERVFREVYGIEARLTEIDFSGKSVEAVIRELALRKGVPFPEIKGRLREAVAALERAFSAEIGRRNEIRPLPGVIGLLEGLKQRGVLLGVVTGNSERIGRTILQRSSLLSYFQVFAFGPEGRDKSDLVALAVERGRPLLGEGLRGREVAVVGDSVQDVAGGKAFGALTLAVTTGIHTREELLSRHPDHLLDDLGDTESILKILSPTSPERALP
jgi:phosphoglycolate phosphatase-like HAD superfamily hydrolase